MGPLCVIPARGGSKRLPRKNIRPLAGKPMLAWTIEAARGSGVFDEVRVSTEDAEIAEIAAAHGAAVHERPAALAQDLSSSTDVCLDLADAHPQHEALVCLQPTSPLMTGGDIGEAWQRFASKQAAYLVSVTPIDPHYFHWAVHEEQGEWSPFFGDRYMRDRLELPDVFRPNGAIKIASVAALRDRGNFFGAPLAAHAMPEERAIHVATELDLRMAEMLLTDRMAEAAS